MGTTQDIFNEEDALVPDILWTPVKEGERVSGVVVEILEGRYGSTYIIADSDGNRHQTPAHKVLQRKLETVEISDIIGIEYLGTTPSAEGNPTTLYKVWHKKVK